MIWCCCHNDKVDICWTPDTSRSGFYFKIALVITLFRLVSESFFSETALMIFMKLDKMSDIDGGKK